ncbi:MAG TPA: BTAD domain-containing putative transcriptional regulator [Gemmatimonadaceae bacterium]|nr:BTAD domain-containing putative transcriptional regulator [Gemmatimonadaceae bacterium]
MEAASRQTAGQDVSAPLRGDARPLGALEPSPRMDAGIRVSLFGGVRILVDGAPAEPPLAHGTQALLAYLLLHRHRQHARGVLAALFWGERDEQHALACLSTALWRLRAALEPLQGTRGRYLIATASEVGFNRDGGYWLDVEVFEHLLAGRLVKPAEVATPADVLPLETAVSLYHGELLEGFYDEWALAERERLHRLYLDVLTRLMHWHVAAGAAEESLRYAQRLLREDPLREDGHRVAMRSYALSGERSLAVRQYQVCRELLSSELGVAPSRETRELHARIAATSNPGFERVVPRHGESELVSPDVALERAMAMLDSAHQQVQEAYALLHRIGENPPREQRSDVMTP